MALSAFMAGVCISVGCIVNLQVGGIAGAILFTFCLVAVVHYQYKLYTGTAGFVDYLHGYEILNFAGILLMNIVGCYAMSKLAGFAILSVSEKASLLLDARVGVDNWQALLRAVMCGFLMTTAVKFAREGRIIPLLFAVPVFILAGFYHSIADAFYMFAADRSSLGYSYAFVVLGNLIGCNLHHITLGLND